MALIGATALAAGFAWRALTPRPDWYAPVHVLPAHFRWYFGGWGVDKPLHALAAAGLTTLYGVGAWLRRATPWREIFLRTTLCVQLGGVLIEFLQGFLPYRNFEALDLAANFAGGFLAFLAAAALSHLVQATRASEHVALGGQRTGEGEMGKTGDQGGLDS